MAFNFKVFDTVAMAEEGATLHFIVPKTGLPAYNGETPLSVTFRGPKSKDGRAALQKCHARVRAMLKKYDKHPDAVLNDEESAQKRKIYAEAFAEMAINWTGFEDEKGKPIPLTKENILSFYANYLDLHEQTERFILAEESFLKD